MCASAIRTVALLFSVTGLIILNEFCRLLFVLTMFINRLKGLTQQSSGRLNDSFIYIFSLWAPANKVDPQRGLLKHTHAHLHTACSSDWASQLSVTVSLDGGS